ncbi:MAG: hypothetical protein ACRDWD_11130 [Acidimicrobiia bacterium]
MELVGPHEVRHAGELAVVTLEPLAESADWTVPAGALAWTCRRTLDHLCDCLLYYSGQLARRTDRQGPLLRDGDAEASITTLVTTVGSAAAVLAAVAEGTPPDARAYHPAGMADRSGYCAMGVDELLVHTDDIAAGLGVPFDPPAEICAVVVARLFRGRRPATIRGRPCAGPTAESRWATTGRSTRTGTGTARRSPSGTATAHAGARHPAGREARYSS